MSFQAGALSETGALKEHSQPQPYPLPPRSDPQNRPKFISGSGFRLVQDSTSNSTSPVTNHLRYPPTPPSTHPASDRLPLPTRELSATVDMGNKRPHADSEPAGQHFEDPGRKRMRTATTNNRPHRPRPAPVDLDSLNAIKKRARNIERLLARDNLKLPSHKQRDLERELAAHKGRIEDAVAKKDRGKMIGKYHMVRFFGMPTSRSGLPVFRG